MTGRGLRGRRIARLTMATAVVVDAVAVWLVLAAPHPVGPPTAAAAPRADWSWLWAGAVVAHVLGYLWMIRIYRADPEARPSAWRSHRS